MKEWSEMSKVTEAHRTQSKEAVWKWEKATVAHKRTEPLYTATAPIFWGLMVAHAINRDMQWGPGTFCLCLISGILALFAKMRLVGLEYEIKASTREIIYWSSPPTARRLTENRKCQRFDHNRPLQAFHRVIENISIIV